MVNNFTYKARRWSCCVIFLDNSVNNIRAEICIKALETRKMHNIYLVTNSLSHKLVFVFLYTTGVSICAAFI